MFSKNNIIVKILKYVFCLALFFQFYTVNAAYLYVSKDGTNYHNDHCLVNDPCKTIKHAIYKSDDGDTIFVAAWIYQEAELKINKSITLLWPNANVDPRIAAWLRSAGSTGEAIIDGENDDKIIIKIEKSDVVVNWFEIRNTEKEAVKYDNGHYDTNFTLSYNIIHNSDKQWIILESATNELIDYNLIFDTRWIKVEWKWYWRNHIISNNEFYNISGEKPTILVYKNKGSLLIDNNYIHDVTTGNWISIVKTKSSSSISSKITIKNNIIENSNFLGHEHIYHDKHMSMHGDAIMIWNYYWNYVYSNDSILVEWNTIRNNNGSLENSDVITWNGIYISRSDNQDNFTCFTISGNTISGNSGYWISYNVWNKKLWFISNNIITNNALGGVYIWAQVPVTVEAREINPLIILLVIMKIIEFLTIF